MDAVKDGIGQQGVKEIYEGGSTESLKFQAPPSRDSRDNTSVNSNYQYRGK